MRYIFQLSLAVCLLLFISCSTPYQPKGSLGGYSEEKILTNMYKIAFQGNQHSKPEIIQKYLLYRSAELTQEMGYDYFAIVNEERHFDESSVRPTRGASFQTRSSMSGGTRTIASPDLQTASKSTNYTGVYFIKFLNEIDDKYKNAVFNVDEVMKELSEIVKK